MVSSRVVKKVFSRSAKESSLLGSKKEGFFLDTCSR